MVRLIAASLVAASLGAFAAEPQVFNLVIENHKFTPDRIEGPAGQKVKLLVDNKDATPEELGSPALKVEKAILDKTKGTIYIRPLNAAENKFAGEPDAKNAHRMGS